MSLNFTHGLNKKPAASEALEQVLKGIQGLAGECFFGYPLIATPEGKLSIDATVISVGLTRAGSRPYGVVIRPVAAS